MATTVNPSAAEAAITALERVVEELRAARNGEHATRSMDYGKGVAFMVDRIDAVITDTLKEVL